VNLCRPAATDLTQDDIVVPHARQLSLIGTYSRQCGQRMKLFPVDAFMLASADRSR